MTVKFLLAAALAAMPVPASDADAMFVNLSAVHQVFCAEGRGTAFEAGGRMISVNHVTSLSNCHIGSDPVVPTPEGDLDFSTIALPAQGFRVNCEGFKNGEYYWAVGYADGNPIQRVTTLVGTGERDPGNGEALLLGDPTVIPGMSGGPIFNSAGEVVGTVNMYSQIFPISLSRELKDTSLCQGSASARP
jgi:hypothetical protein